MIARHDTFPSDRPNQPMSENKEKNMSTAAPQSRSISSASPDAATVRPLHRLGEVRQQERLTLRTIARQMQESLRDIRQQEDPRSDIALSTLYQWQEVLGVPIADLLVEPKDNELSSPVDKRARMVRLMKSARSLEEMVSDEQTQRMVARLLEQIVEIMPELATVSPWNLVGQRRTEDELGIAAMRSFPDDMFSDYE